MRVYVVLTLVPVPGEMPYDRGSMWRHHEACVEAKLSHEGRVAVGCFYLKLDHYAHEVKWFSKISRGMLGSVIYSLYK